MDDLYDFLFQIPFVYSYELDFNAFLEQESSSLPVINFYYVLFFVLEHFAETIANIILKSDDDYQLVNLRNEEEIISDSEKPENLLTIISCIKMIKGEVTVISRVKSSADSSQRIFSNLTVPAVNFVTLHEIGHLLLGHLTLPYHKELEYEADEFAGHYLVILIESMEEKARLPAFIGMATLFILVYCKEKLIPANNQSKYPTAIERFVELAKCFKPEDRIKLADASNHAVVATAYTLREVFQLEVPHCELN